VAQFCTHSLLIGDRGALRLGNVKSWRRTVPQRHLKLASDNSASVRPSTPRTDGGGGATPER
jgi:hypothetical protein